MYASCVYGSIEYTIWKMFMIYFNSIVLGSTTNENIDNTANFPSCQECFESHYSSFTGTGLTQGIHQWPGDQGWPQYWHCQCHYNLSFTDKTHKIILNLVRQWTGHNKKFS